MGLLLKQVITFLLKVDKKIAFEKAVKVFRIRLEQIIL